jgi:apolipoprotein N-acyltransferase
MQHLADRVILLAGWHRALAAFLAGAVAAFSQSPFDFFAACFVSFPILVWLLDGASAQPGENLLRRALRPFIIGWWFGFGYFLAGIWWIGNALLVEADLFAWALPLAVLGLPALIAVFYGVAIAVARLLWSDGIGRIAALAVGFAAAEWLRTFVFTGFPWNPVGQAAMPTPLLMQSVGIVSMTGMNLLAVFVFAIPATLISASGRKAGVIVAVIIAGLHVGYGAYRLGTAEKISDKLLSVRLVQPSIEQSSKWDAAKRGEIFRTYLNMSKGDGDTEEWTPELIVWPETSVPFILARQPEALVALGEMLEDNQNLLAGAVRIEGDGADARYYNAVVAINDEGQTYDAVDKIRLVPFGEYLPLADILSQIGLQRIVQNVSDFSPGGQRRAITLSGNASVLPFICYEIIFPGIAGYGDADADVILNVTNDAWFGDTPGPYQHFRQAQIRAVEARRPIIRSANNGISGVIDPYGRVLDAFAIDAIGTLDVDVPLIRTTSIVTQPQQVGAGLVLVFAIWAGAGMLRARRRVD